MSIYLITGKLGAGKTLISVARIRDALRAGRRVATNLDLNLDRFLPARARSIDCIRLPDKPGIADLELIGCGNESMNEEMNGLIVLDELASWLNAREWADKGRQAVIDWLIHSRKHGWDVMFIAQHLDQIDKQVRTALVEYHVPCGRLDRISVPLFGGLIRLLSGGWLSGRLPKMHFATMKYGTYPDSPKAESWWYLASDLYAAYNTRQVFSSTYAHGVFSYLTPWHTKGRYLVDWRVKLKAWFNGAAIRRPVAVPKLPLVALLQRLSPDERVRHWQRLEASGAF